MLSEKIKCFFKEEKIEYYAEIAAHGIGVINQSLLGRKFGGEAKSLLVMLVPYLVRDEGSISLYARSRDYHLYFDRLFSRLLPLLKAEHPENSFAAFADSSPFDERAAASTASLGVIGDNRLIINEKYGSYVFIGEVVSDLEAADVGRVVNHCPHCGKCGEGCPSPSLCLSALSQKKKPSDGETELLKKNKIVWGCDRCQSVCPLNENAAETPIEFFRTDRICFPDTETIEGMSDEEFSKRAFAWKGRETIVAGIKRAMQNDLL